MKPKKSKTAKTPRVNLDLELKSQAKIIRELEEKNADLIQQLLGKQIEANTYHDQLHMVLGTLRWRTMDLILRKTSFIRPQPIIKVIKKTRFALTQKIRSSDPVDNGASNTHFNPYHLVELHKKINVVVLDQVFSPETIKHKFSTVTTIFNEGTSILLFLKSLEAQTLRPSEVVLVDGGSTDDTIKVVERFAKKSKLKINLVQGKKLNIPQGRNLAIKKAKYEFLVLADAGTIIDPNYCASLMGCFVEHPDAEIVGGIFHSIKPTHFSKYFIPDWESIDFNEFLPSTRSMAMKKSTIVSNGFYPEYLQTGDDTLFDLNVRRNSHLWVINKKAFVFWESPTTKIDSDKLCWRYGKGDGESGIGDFLYYDFFFSEKRKLPIVDPLSRIGLYKGYKEGKRRRPEIDILNRKISGLLVFLSDYPLSDLSEKSLLNKIRRVVEEGYRVVHVSQFSTRDYFDGKVDLGLDLSLLSLFHYEDFSVEEVLEGYRGKIGVDVVVNCRRGTYERELATIKQMNDVRFLKENCLSIPEGNRRLYLPFADCQINGLAEILIDSLGYKRDGYFVEIGAFDGKTHSNSSFLADIGWKGIYIEPVPAFAKLCQERHEANSVEVVTYAVGSYPGKIKMHLAGEYSTTLYEPGKFYLELGFNEVAKLHSRSIWVKQVTLESVLNHHKAKRDFDLLILDTESTEWEILSAFEIGKWNPKVVIIEMHEESLDWNKSQLVKSNNVLINGYFVQNGYKKIYSDQINSIFVLGGIKYSINSAIRKALMKLHP